MKARLDLDPIKNLVLLYEEEIPCSWAQWEDAQSGLCEAAKPLIAEVERLRSALLQPDLDRKVCDVIERLRVECSEHRSAGWNLGAIYALDALKPRLRALLLCEAQGRRHEEEQETKISTRTDATAQSTDGDLPRRP